MRQEMIRNVLLLLSSEEPPEPRAEMAWHVREAAQHGVTYLVTTRVLTDLTPGESSVAFYGDAELGNALLGYGRFDSYTRSDDWRQPLPQVYAEHGMPEGAQGFVGVRRMVAAESGAAVDALGGTIRSRGASDGLPLTLDNLPKSAARLQVYFTTPRPLGDKE